MSDTMRFVAAAPGKLILAGEHSVVHHTRALATVIAQRTFVQLEWTPASPAEAATSACEVSLSIETDKLQIDHSWSYDALAAHAASLPPLPASMADLVPLLDSAVKPSLASLPRGAETAPSVFLLYYLALLRPSMARGSLRVRIVSQLPMSAGLGSSASFSAALAAAFMHLAHKLAAAAGKQPSQREGDFLGAACDCASTPCADAASTATATLIPCLHVRESLNAWSFEGERIIHGNPSGVDNSCAVHGGVIIYRRGEPLRFLTPQRALQLLVVNSRVPRDTKALVAGVGALKQQHPRVMQRVFEAVDELVDEWLALLGEAGATLDTAAAEQRAGELMRLNQGLLESMGVGHDIITRVLAAAARHGMRGGKLTGAGGGGCILVLKGVDCSAKQLQAFGDELSQQMGCEHLETIVGQAGVWIREDCTHDDLPELKQQQAQQ